MAQTTIRWNWRNAGIIMLITGGWTLACFAALLLTHRLWWVLRR